MYDRDSFRRKSHEEESQTHQHLGADLRFAIDFAKAAGEYMLQAWNTAIATEKLDRTVVTDVDIAINSKFIEAIKSHSGARDSVIGEEESALISNSEKVWVIDPLDGTGEYVDVTVPNDERTTCIGVAMFKEEVLQLSTVFKPFNRELFVADRNLGSAFLNGERLDVTKTEIGQATFEQNLPYDYCYWDGSPTDARFLEEIVGRPPIDSYSAINQACDVSKGVSAFDVFPGSTIHDIAPGTLIVELAGGKVSGIDGQPLEWNKLNGAVYAANQQILDTVVNELRMRATT